MRPETAIGGLPDFAVNFNTDFLKNPVTLFHYPSFYNFSSYPVLQALRSSHSLTMLSPKSFPVHGYLPDSVCWQDIYRIARHVYLPPF